jgi:DNA polymerase IV
MDCFFVSVERALNPTLQNKPVIVGGKPNSRGVVSACSYETRKHGIHSGLALATAYKLYPKSIFLEPNFQAYKFYSQAVLKILKKYIPIIEQASIDEFYLDLTGCKNLYGDLFNFTWKLKKHLEATLKLPLSIGMATNKHIAKVASTLAKPSSLLAVIPGQEKTFLSQLSVSHIQGIGKQTLKTLNERGIKTINQLAAIPIEDISKLLGKWGIALHLKANGNGNTNFIENRNRKSISAERTFANDTCDKKQLITILGILSEKLGFQLRKEKWQAKCICIKLRYSDFKTQTTQITVTTTDQDEEIFKTAKHLFEKLYQRRVRLRLIGLRLSRLQKESMVPLFFSSLKKDQIYQAIDKIKTRYGKNALHLGVSVAHKK